MKNPYLVILDINTPKIHYVSLKIKKKKKRKNILAIILGTLPETVSDEQTEF